MPADPSPSPSSNLSPDAPPFNVVTSLPWWSSFSGASFFPRPSHSAAGGEALYPDPEGYGVGPWDWTSPIGGREGNGGRGAGSSWLEPSYKAEEYRADSLPAPSRVWHENHLGSFAGKVHLASECPESLYQRHSAVYEADIGPPIISREPVLSRSPSAKGKFYPQLAESSINFNSCDAFMGYTANSCANLAQVHEPSSRIATSFADFSMLRSGYSEDLPVNPYKTDTVFKDQNSSNLKEFSGNRFAGVKEFYDEMLGKSNMKVHTSMPVYTSTSKTSWPSCSDLANEIPPSASSEVETVEACIKLKPLVLPSASIYESGLAEPSNSNGSSSQALDQINCYVDSPCWKRAPISRTSVGLNSSVWELNNADDLDQDQKHLPLSIDNSKTPPSQQVGTLICNEIVKASPGFPSSESSVPSLQNILHDADKSRSDRFETNYNSKIHSNDVGMDQNRNSEENDIKVPSDKEETVVSSIQPIKEGPFSNNVTDLKPETQESSSVKSCGKPFSGTYVELLVKSISSLSEVLLSLCIGGTNELKEQDHHLLELALHNLDLVTRQSNKVASGSSSPEPAAAGLQDKSLELDGLNLTKNITNHDMKGKLNSSSNNVSDDGIEESSKICMAQAFEKVFEETLSDQEESPQALIYKNLWIEAEAALCSMKYEVQRARMKMETENPKHPVNGRPPPSSMRNSVHVPDGGDEERSSGNITPHRSGAEDHCDSKSHQESADTTEAFDAAVLATLRILESPNGYSDSTVKDQQLSQYKGKGKYCSTSSEVFDGSAVIKPPYSPFQQRHPPIGYAGPSSEQRHPPIWYAGPSSEWEHLLKENIKFIF